MGAQSALCRSCDHQRNHTFGEKTTNFVRKPLIWQENRQFSEMTTPFGEKTLSFNEKTPIVNEKIIKWSCSPANSFVCLDLVLCSNVRLLIYMSGTDLRSA